MTDRRRPRALLALLVLVALVLITIDFREGDDGPLSELQRAAFGVFAPLQNAVATVTRPVGEFTAGLRDIGRRRERIDSLEAELEAVRQQRVSIADLQRENAELRELLNMRERREFTTLTSRVIAQPPGRAQWTVLIDAGTDDGVAPDMAVVNADGLVGKVTEVAPAYARLQLANSPEANYAVRLAQGGERALLSGSGQRPMELQIIDDTDEDLDAGVDVVTRAYQGSRIPDGLPVGTLVDGGPADVIPSFPVQPAVDFARLDLVMVVLDAPERPLELDPGDTGEDDADHGGPDEGREPDDEPAPEEIGLGADGEPRWRALDRSRQRATGRSPQRFLA